MAIVALGVCLAVAAALVAVIFLISVATTTLVLTRTHTRTRKGVSGSAAFAALAGGGLSATLETKLDYTAPNTTPLDVIPLRWDAQALVYMVDFTVGTNMVDAAFDTGSAQFVVATSACTSCTGKLYDAAASKASVALYDPRGATDTTLCQATIAYGSQTDTITMFSDTLRFDRRQLPQPTVLCSAPSVDAAMTTTQNGEPFVIDAFPVAGVTSNTGSSSLNVFGMSAVLSATKLGADFLLPSCQTSRVAAYESPMLQAVAGYLLNNAPSVDMVWSMALGATRGFFLFAALRLPCLAVQYTPLVRALPSAGSTLSRTPGRYYVVRVAAWTLTPRNGSTAPLPNAPAMLVVDTGTTSCMMSAPAAAAMSAMRPGDVSVLTLQPVAAGAAAPQITFTAASTTFGDAAMPVFAPIDSTLATAFASDGSVGILGATAMHGLYLEFNLTKQVMGVAYM